MHFFKGNCRIGLFATVDTLKANAFWFRNFIFTCHILRSSLQPLLPPQNSSDVVLDHCCQQPLPVISLPASCVLARSSLDNFSSLSSYSHYQATTDHLRTRLEYWCKLNQLNWCWKVEDGTKRWQDNLSKSVQWMKYNEEPQLKTL